MSLLVGELYVKLNLDSTSFSKLLDAAKKDLKAISQANLDLNAKIKIDTSGANIAKSATDALKGSLQGVQSQVSQASSSFFNLGNVIKDALAYFSGSLIVNGMQAITSSLGSIVPIAADFQAQMSGIKAVTDLTGISMEDMQQKALDLGAKTQYSASQAANAMEMLAKNGLTGMQILEGGIDTALAFAAATGTDLTNASDVASTAILQFNLSAAQMPQAIDVMTGAVNASRMSVDDLKLAMANGGGIANQYGVSIKDFNTALAATINQFSGGSDAGTSFKTFLLSLNPTTKEATTAFRELGIITADGTNKFFTASGELKSMGEVFGIVREAIGGLPPQLQQMYGKLIFGTDAIRMMNGILQTSESDWQNLSRAIGETSASDQAAIRMDNLNGVIEAVRGSLETLWITIGTQALPGLQQLGEGLVSIINSATTLVQAISGSQDAFNNLSPALQIVVVAIQDVMSYFSGLADAALAWGQNIGSSFASGILDAASSVINALMEMGSWIEYWLAPGSPPRVAPDLDLWGKEVAEVYFGAFGQANPSILRNSLQSVINSAASFSIESLSGLKQLTKQAQDLIDNMFVGNTTNDKINILETTLGTKTEIQAALSEFENTGTVAESVFSRIAKVAGKAGQSIAQYVRLYFDQQKAVKALQSAQEQLIKSQQKLNDLESAKTREASPVQKALDEIQAKQALLDLDQEIADQTVLANAVGGDGSVQRSAQLKLQELALKKQLLLIEQNHKAGIDQAKTEVESSQSAVDAAEEKKRQIDQQIALEEAKMQAMMDQNNLVREQIQLTRDLIEEQKKALETTESKRSGGGGGGSKGVSDADKNAKAQEAYNYQLADTEGKLGLLRAKLATVEEGSAEYYQILGDINTLEQKQAAERKKIADDEAKEKELAVKAQKDYEYSVASTGDKLKILKERLAGVKEGSAEYYDILKQIDSVQNQYDKEQEQKTKGGTGGAGMPKPGAGGVGTSTGTGANPVIDAVENVNKTFDDAKQKIEETRVRLEKFREGVSSARSQLMEFISPITTVAGNLKGLLVPALAALATPIIIGAISGIGGVLLGLLSPIGLLALAVGALVLAWQTNFMNIQEHTAQALSYVQMLFDTFKNIVMDIWQEHGTQIMQTVQTIWNTVKEIVGNVLLVIVEIFRIFVNFVRDHQEQIKTIIYGSWTAISGIIQGALTFINGIIKTVLSIIRGDWQGAWEGIKQILEGIWIVIISIVTGVLNNLAVLFGTNIDGLRTMWQNFWSNVKDTAERIFNQTATVITTTIANITVSISTFIRDRREQWASFWASVKESAESFMSKVKDSIGSSLSAVASTFQTKISEFITSWNRLQELPAKIGSFLQQVKDRISSMAGDFVNAAKSIGEGIVSGIVKGLTQGLASVIDAAKNIATAAVEAAKGVLDSHSPSRVFIDIGQNVSRGMAIGIQDKLSAVHASMRDLIPPMPVMQPAFATSAAINSNSLSPSIINQYFSIDARGSTMSEDQYRKITREEIQVQVLDGVRRRR